MSTSEKSCGFPTLGEVVKFAFAASGVSSRKRGNSDEISTEQIKQITKRLERLSKEDGELSENLRQSVSDLSLILSGTIKSRKALAVIIATAFDLLTTYNSVIVNEGTWLHKKDSMLWFLRTYMSRLAFSVEKHALINGLSHDLLSFPDEPDWFIPTFTDEGMRWPIGKAIEWVYAKLNTYPSDFHCLTANDDVNDVESHQRWENASDWAHGKRLPSWTTLHWTFSQSMGKWERQKENQGIRISESLRQSITLVLFIARLSTYVSREVLDTYKQETLKQLVADLLDYKSFTHDCFFPLEKSIADDFLKRNLTSTSSDALWRATAERHFEYFMASDMPYLMAGKAFMRGMDREMFLPERFAEEVIRGIELASNPGISSDDVVRYTENLCSQGLTPHMPWMKPWLIAVVLRIQGDLPAALLHAEDAFESAKYCAGKYQRDLLLEFLNLSAANSSWKQFKKGVEWARYLGLVIDGVPFRTMSNEDIRAVYERRKRRPSGDLVDF